MLATLLKPLAVPARADARVFLKDYKPFPFHVRHVSLAFDVKSTLEVLVSASLDLEVVHPHLATPWLELNGAENLEMQSIWIDDKVLTDYERDADMLRIRNPPRKAFTLKSSVKVNPATNLSCAGLYMSGTTLLSQCEAEGFRNITFYPDRPDVLSVFEVSITADPSTFHVGLANGNPISDSLNPDGRRTWKFVDPFPKPAYLFAIVLGKLKARSDVFITRSNVPVNLHVWAKPVDFAKTSFAMDCVHRAMRWDEEEYNREYDLAAYHVVAVDDFNFGAMENKGLNVFAASCILTSPETSTDARFADVEATIAHEYFHNWSGNRVTVRDWFGVSLKEGLTTFREQQFCKVHHGKAVCDISNQRYMTSSQFTEDAGQMKHAVRPEAYESIDNFYTATVYQKGACIIGMMARVLGRDGFRAGLDLYFSRHDGQAVTIEDLIKSLGDANKVDLSSFLTWYSQSGTPIVTVEVSGSKVKLTQQLDDSQPMPIPVDIAVFNKSGVKMVSQTLLLTEAEQEFELYELNESTVLSVLRGFSAPVRIVYPQRTNFQLMFLLKHESDACAKFSAAQTIVEAAVLTGQVDAELVDALRAVLLDSKVEPGLRAEILACIPSVAELAIQGVKGSVDPLSLHEKINSFSRDLAKSLESDLRKVYDVLVKDAPEEFKFEVSQVGNRALKNQVLHYLVSYLDDHSLGLQVFKAATNFTDRLAALYSLSDSESPQREEAFGLMRLKYADESLVMRSYLRCLCSSDIAGNLSNVKAVMASDIYNSTNPESIRAAVCGFASSTPNFHRADSSGYQFVTEMIQLVDKFNPTVAAQICDDAFSDWLTWEEPVRNRIAKYLRILESDESISKHVSEVVSKALED